MTTNPLAYWKDKKRPDHAIRHRKWMLENNPFRGKKHSKETKEKMRKAKLGKRGNETNRWIGGFYYVNHKRGAREYFNWVKEILEIDNYTCQRCNRENIILHTHHILPVDKFPSLVLEKENGITLCGSCHSKLHWRNRRNAL